MISTSCPIQYITLSYLEVLGRLDLRKFLDRKTKGLAQRVSATENVK